MSKNSFLNRPIVGDTPQRKKKKGGLRWWHILIILFLLGGFMSLLDSIKASAHPALYFTLLGIAVAAVLVCAFFLFRHLTKTPETEKKNPEPEPAPEPVKQVDLYEFYRVKTVGVTFTNEDGSSRQDLIRRLYYHEPPFENKEIELALEEYEYRGEPAFKVLANGYQIGCLSKADAKYLDENQDRCVTLCGADIVGGDKPKDEYSLDDYDDDDDGDDPLDYLHLDDFDDDFDDDDDGEPLKWGLHFNIKFRK